MIKDFTVDEKKKEDKNGIYNHCSLLNAISTGVKFTNEMSMDGDLDPSLFKVNPNGWNIRKACTWLHSNSSLSSQHACAKFVRMAIEAGGIKTDGRPNWAWKYINYLPTIGFKGIAKVPRNQMHLFNAQPGDIAVYQKGNDPSVPGHICMWTGAGWESDFKQKDMIVYQSTPIAYIFRFQA